jgi:hypothetical protein
MPLDLLVPDLLVARDAPGALRGLRLPALERWLARADIDTVAGEAYAWLASAYGLASPAAVAAISMAGEGLDPEGAWLRADPVHLRIDHDALMLHDAAVLDIDIHEARALVDSLQRHFAGDGLTFAALAPSRWYVRVDKGALPRTTALRDAVGRNVFDLLPEAGAYNWRSALTEAQMTLAAHEVNRARESAGALQVNSVWFWGEGESPASVARAYTSVYADDAFARGLGRLSGASVHALPKSIEAIDLAREDERVLVVLDSLTPSLHRADAAAWVAAAGALDDAWFAKLANARARFGSVRLILPGPRGTRVASLDGSTLWRLFRTRRPLAAHA